MDVAEAQVIGLERVDDGLRIAFNLEGVPGEYPMATSLTRELAEGKPGLDPRLQFRGVEQLQGSVCGAQDPRRPLPIARAVLGCGVRRQVELQFHTVVANSDDAFDQHPTGPGIP